MKRRVKITGLGPVTPAGIGRESFFHGINESVSRVREVTRIDPRGGPFVAAQIEGFDLREWVSETRNPKRIPRQTQFALAGTALALEDAGISLEELKGKSPVIINGSALQDPEISQRTYTAVATKGPRYAVPAAIFDAGPSSISNAIANLLGTQCRTVALHSACCAGLDSIGHGREMIASGQADIAICCGTEAPVFQQPMIELTLAKLSPRNARNPSEMGRPFDLWRNTGVIGEGAGVLILECEESPRRAYAWVGGYAYGNDDAGEPGNGLEMTIRMAIANSSFRPAAIDYVNAWGPGHTEIDRVEAGCLCRAFGDRIASIPVASLKGAIGNPLAAAGSIQACSAALSLQTGRIPPTVNWVTPDPECPLNLSGEFRDVGCSAVLINSHGLCGTNSSLVLFKG